MDECTCECPAKVNLSLAILGHDENARMHMIDTVIAKISLTDTVVLRLREGHGISVALSLELPPALEPDISPEDNTITRAYEELDMLIGGELPGMEVRVTKRIPVGGGLGGGSSDAAGFLSSIQEMLAKEGGQEMGLAPLMQLSEGDWLRLASRVGADVPAFMLRRSVRARGFGERVEPVSLAGLGDYRCVLGIPGVSLSTKAMYSKVKSFSSRNHTQDFLDEWNTSGLGKALKAARNDFTPVVLNESGEIKDLFDRLVRQGYPLVSVAGSGSCVFAVARPEDAESAGLPVYEFVG